MKPITALTLILATIIFTTGIYSIGNGVYNIRGNRRILHVKGLAEQNVEANYVVWNLSSSPKKDKDYEKIKSNALKIHEEIIDFLKANGINESEIIKSPPSIYAQYNQIRDKDVIREDETPFYTSSISVEVQSERLDVIKQAYDKIGLFLEKDIPISGSPRYLIRDFDKFRPKLIELAAESALRVAKQIAEKAGSKVGKLRQADQGSIRILNPNTDDSYSSEKNIEQKLRVVSTFVFELN